MEHVMTLRLSLSAPREVRHSLEARYAESMERSLLDDVTVLTSEMVTNAVVHSGRPSGDELTVTARVADGTLRVEVTDMGQGMHNLAARSVEPPSGLGYLQLMSDRWSSWIDDAFHVWFEIDVVARPLLYRAPA
jgi:anti-sigma regulatory factor (Ser/Thr protein kinase)